MPTTSLKVLTSGRAKRSAPRDKVASVPLQLTDGSQNHHRGTRLAAEPTEVEVSERNQLNDLTAREWVADTKSVWFQKGLGAGHEHAQIERQHPAPYSYQDVMRLIRFFTKEGGRVLDPFLGVGSTLKACALSGRWGVGVELIERWVSLSRRRLSEEVGPHALASQEVIRGDSRIVLQDSGRFPDASMDFVVCSPPYWKILTKKADHKVKSERLKHGLATQYSEEPADLGNMPDYLAFLDGVCDVFDQCWRILKPGKYAAIVVGDFRHHNRFIAYHADLFERLTNPAVGGRYEPQGIIIWAQNHKRLYPYGYPFAFVPNLHHQYVLIVRKPKEKADRAQPRKPGRQAPRIKAKG